MFSFSSQERLVAMVVALVLFAGTIIQYGLKRFPAFERWMNVIESSRFYPRVDVNLASYEELERVPYIGEKTARAIMAYRETKGRVTSLEELENIPGIYSKNFHKFCVYLKIVPERR
jgi:competence ComEA-like helix-hairpin-helix protein